MWWIARQIARSFAQPYKSRRFSKPYRRRRVGSYARFYARSYVRRRARRVAPTDEPKKVYYWQNVDNGKVYVGSCSQDKSKNYICSSLFFAWAYTAAPQSFRRRVIERESSVKREHHYIWRAWRKYGWEGIYNAQVGRALFRYHRWHGTKDRSYIRDVLLAHRGTDLFRLNWDYRLDFATMKDVAHEIICEQLRCYRGSYYR